MTFKIEGSTILITAGTSGLGLCVAQKLISLGANVVVNYASNHVRARGVLQKLFLQALAPHRTTECNIIQADVTKRSEIERLVAETVEWSGGRLDAVVSNAGWTQFADFFNLDENVDEEVWDKCYAANVKSHLFLCHAAKKHLEEAKGAFVMTSSVAGVKPSGSSIVSLTGMKLVLGGWVNKWSGLLCYQGCSNPSS